MFARYAIAISVGASMACAAHGATYAPAPVLSSSLTVQIEEVAQVVPASSGNNLASPVPIHGDLYVVDQRGEILRRNGDSFDSVFTTTDAPAGVTLDSRNAVLNMAAGRNADEIFVVFTSQTLPEGGFPLRSLPPPLPGLCCTPPMLLDDLYRIDGPDSTDYQVLYKYTLDSGDLVDPVPVAAFEVQSGNGAHNGGGILTLPDGQILYATGDNLPPGTDGRAAAQDPAQHVSKLLLIDPDTGVSTTAAVGVRNVQQLQFNDPDTQTDISFADIGGVTAEEINTVAIATLTDTGDVENFGWGRNADGMAREGTFYVGPGRAQTPEEPAAIGNAPIPETGFIQPLAQFGRERPEDSIAATGPVTSSLSFDMINSLFSDLSRGSVFATLTLNGVDVPIYSVKLVNPDRTRTSLLELSGFRRADPRFFRFNDGTAGVLLERGGKIYRLTEVATVPLPAPVLLLGASVLLLLRTGRGLRAS